MKIIIVIITIISCIPLHAQTDTEVSEIVGRYRNKYNVPALAASVIKFDTVYYGVSGVQRVDTNKKIDLDSRFHLGSNTKAITSMLAARLVESGTLDWDTKLLDVVPELKGKINTAYSNIMLESLLSHRAMIAPFEDDGSKEWRKMPESSINSSTNQKLAFAKYALNIDPTQNDKTNHSTTRQHID